MILPTAVAPGPPCLRHPAQKRSRYPCCNCGYFVGNQAAAVRTDTHGTGSESAGYCGAADSSGAEVQVIAAPAIITSPIPASAPGVID